MIANTNYVNNDLRSDSFEDRGTRLADLVFPYPSGRKVRLLVRVMLAQKLSSAL